MRSITKTGIISLLLLGGCFGGGTPTPTVVYPIIQIPNSPQLHTITQDELRPLNDDTIRKLVMNDNRLKNHIEKLEAAINAYNKWATER